MNNAFNYMRNHLGRFRRVQDGTATVEVVLWLPVFAALMMLIADTSLIFGGEARVLRIVQDGNRALSIGRFLTVEEARAFILSEVTAISPNATVQMFVSQGIIYSTVTMPATDFAATPVFNVFTDLTLRVSAEHLSEV